MKLHPRTLPVQKAKGELTELVLAWAQKHDLTIGEIVASLLEESRSWMKYVLRDERHPDDPEKKADEE